MLAIDGLMARRTFWLVKVRRLPIAALRLALQHTTIIATNHNGVSCRGKVTAAQFGITPSI